MAPSSAIHRIPANNAARITSNSVLLLVATGYQTVESVNKLRDDAATAVRKLRKAGQKVIVLIDASRVQGREYRLESETFKTIESLDFDIMAIYGLPDENRKNIDSRIAKAGEQNRIRTFSDQRSATSWLACHVIKHRDGSIDGQDPAVCDLLPIQ